MPYDFAKETGTWKAFKNSDNYPDLLQKIGVPAEMIPQVLELQFEVEMTVSGDSFTYKLTEFGSTSVNTFTLGVQSEELDSWGTKRMVTYTVEGDSLLNTYPSVDGKGTGMRISRRFLDDNTIRMTMAMDGMEAWYEAKRV